MSSEQAPKQYKVTVSFPDGINAEQRVREGISVHREYGYEGELTKLQLKAIKADPYLHVAEVGAEDINTVDPTEAKKLLEDAQAEADKLLDAAKADAEKIISDAKTKGEDTVNAAKELAKSITDEAKAEAKVAKDATKAEAK